MVRQGRQQMIIYLYRSGFVSVPNSIVLYNTFILRIRNRWDLRVSWKTVLVDFEPNIWTCACTLLKVTLARRKGGVQTWKDRLPWYHVSKLTWNFNLERKFVVPFTLVVEIPFEIGIPIFHPPTSCETAVHITPPPRTTLLWFLYSHDLASPPCTPIEWCSVEQQPIWIRHIQKMTRYGVIIKSNLRRGLWHTREAWERCPMSCLDIGIVT